MLFTASTVKDTLPHLRRFVTGNLAGGADHLVVFLDAEDAHDPEHAEIRAYLDGHPHVTCVRTDRSWWAGDRPAELNVRQRINANVVKAVLSCFDWATAPGSWVFHVDADEIVQVDRDVLAAVPDSERVVQLSTLEAVSRKHWDGEPTWFKRLLDKDDLILLTTLGVIDKPHNGAYFHGHVDGKSGIRPTLDLGLTLHHGVDAEGNKLDRWAHEGLSVLHFESFSGEDFVRKWTSILAAGPRAHFRPGREPTAIALQTLMSKGLSEEQAAPYLMRIFERTTEDDFDTLRDLGMLVQVDPRDGTHVPAGLPAGARDELTGLLEGLRGVGKRAFHPDRPAAEVARLLAAAGAPVPSGSPGSPAAAGRVRAGRSFLRRS